MIEENTRCRHKITFGSYILSDYYEYCVCKKCKEKFEVKQKKFDWLKLLIPLMFLGNILATRKWLKHMSGISKLSQSNFFFLTSNFFLHFLQTQYS